MGTSGQVDYPRLPMNGGGGLGQAGQALGVCFAFNLG